MKLSLVSLLLFLCGCATAPVVPSRPVDEVALRRRTMMESSVEVTFFAERPDGSKPYVGFGTGFVFYVSRGRSLVMTNHHVCFQEDVLDPQRTVAGMAGVQFPAVVVYSSEVPDVCVLMALGVPGDPVSFSAEDPPLGSDVTRVGNDLAVMGKMTAIVTSGVFSGRARIRSSDPELCVYSMHTMEGASGGPIFYRGQVVGMVEAIKRSQQSASEQSQVTFGVCLGDLVASVRRSFETILKATRDAGPDAP